MCLILIFAIKLRLYNGGERDNEKMSESKFNWKAHSFIVI